MTATNMTSIIYREPTTLLVWYPFTGNANDNSGNGNNGTVTGATLTTDRFGIADNAYLFDGSGDYITRNFISVGSARTVSFWVYFDDITDTVVPFNLGHSSGTAANDVMVLYTDGSGSVVFRVGNGTISASVTSGIKLITTWYHITMIYDGTNLILYTNGVPDGTPATIASGLTTGDIFSLGQYRNNNRYPFHGKLDDVRIYNYALSPTEVTELYNGTPSQGTAGLWAFDKKYFAWWKFNGDTNDSSGNALNLTNSNATLTTDRNGNYSAYDFNGTDSTMYVEDTRLNVTSSIALAEGTPSGIFFSPDGLKMFMTGASGNKVYQYSLGTPWDISTLVYDSISLDVSTEDGDPYDLFVNPEGTKMYITGNATDSVYQYTLSTGWDLSTASYATKSFIVAEDATPLGLFFSPDGTKMYVTGDINNKIFQYTLSTAWDVSTASYDTKSLAISGTPFGLFIDPTGKKLFVLDTSDYIYFYNLGTAWDISTGAANAPNVFYIGNQETGGQGVHFSPDGLKCFVVGSGTDKVWQYTLPYPYDFVNTNFENGGTVSAWIYPRTTGESSGRIFDKSRNNAAEEGLYFTYASSGKVQGSIAGGSAKTSATNSVALNQWTHVIMTWTSAGTISFYVNGYLSGTPGTSRPTYWMNNIRRYTIGNRSNATDRTFDGKISDVRLFSRTITAAEALALSNGEEVNSVSEIKLKIGTDSSNYALITAETYAQRNGLNSSFSLQNGLNYLLFDLQSASIVGTINWENINYTELDLTIVSAGEITFDYLTASKSNDIGLNGLGDRNTNWSSELYTW